MSKYTAELRTIIDNGFNIFDFEYSRTPESLAILSNDDLQNGFINHFYFREIGFETLERFKQYLKTKWLESIGEFDKLLVAYNDNINIKSNIQSNITNKSVYNDTPKNKLDESDYASSITDNNQKSTGYAGITESELLTIYRQNLRDIQTEFYKQFDILFMQIF